MLLPYCQDQRGAIQLAESRARSEGREEGMEKGRKEMILQAYRAGMSVEQVASMFGRELSDLEKIVSSEGG